MRRSSVTLLTTLATTAASLAAITVAASPAQAYVYSVNTSTPGHVTGTVGQVNQPWARISVRDEASGLAVSSMFETDSLQQVSFDVEAWGFSSAYLDLSECTDSTPASCGPDSGAVPLQVTDGAAPAVTWPDDLTVGPADTFMVTATTNTGGALRGRWSEWSGSDVPLTIGEPAEIAATDGQQTITIVRCNETVDVCRPTAEVRQATFRRQLTGGLEVGSPAWGPGRVAPQSLAFRIALTDEDQIPGPFDLEVEVRRYGAGIVRTQSFTGVGPDDDFEVDLNDLPTHDYELVARLTWESAEFGTVPGVVVGYVTLDADPPLIQALTKSASTLYPYRDNYLDTVVFTAYNNSGSDVEDATFTVSNAAGVPVLEKKLLNARLMWSHEFTWNGRNGAGILVPGGTYTVKVTLTDPFGHAASTSTTVAVVRKHLANRTWTRTQTAGASYADWKYIGGCSTLRRPSLRGWSGSFGLYSNNRCTKGFNASIAETHHAMYVAKPAGLRRYLDARVSVYGGASTRKPRSTMFLAYYKTSDAWRSSSTMGSALGLHHGPTVGATTAIHDRGTDSPWVYWAAATSEGRRYDVKSFTVRIRYEALVAD